MLITHFRVIFYQNPDQEFLRFNLISNAILVLGF
jgi:hypothetical protein